MWAGLPAQLPPLPAQRLLPLCWTSWWTVAVRRRVSLRAKVTEAVCFFSLANISCLQTSSSTNLPLHRTHTDSQLRVWRRASTLYVYMCACAWSSSRGSWWSAAELRAVVTVDLLCNDWMHVSCLNQSVEATERSRCSPAHRPTKCGLSSSREPLERLWGPGVTNTADREPQRLYLVIIYWIFGSDTD